MKCMKKALVMLMAMVMMFCFPVHAFAADGGGSSASPDSAGLINNYYAALSSGNKRVLLDASVEATDVMAKLGFKDIKIQQCTSSTGSWSNYFEPSDQIAENRRSHYVDDYLVAVPGGYYYRVQLTFYAKETGWFFPSSESITVTTNVVWVSSS